MKDLTPQELAAHLGSFSNDELSKLPHSTLYAARGHLPEGRQDQQNLLSAYEHRAFAREASRENPLLALPIAVATPLYTGAKALGLTDSRSQASLNQMGQGLRGVGEGLWGAFQDGMQSIASRTVGTGRPTSAIGLLESLQRHLPDSSTASTRRR